LRVLATTYVSFTILIRSEILQIWLAISFTHKPLIFLRAPHVCMMEDGEFSSYESGRYSQNVQNP